jgi:hypothetical protein
VSWKFWFIILPADGTWWSVDTLHVSIKVPYFPTRTVYVLHGLSDDFKCITAHYRIK